MAEAVGTIILVFFGVASVQAAVIAGVQTGIWQVAIVWGIGIALAICATGAISGAHLNPAITVAIPGPKGGFFTVYILSPVIGALAGGAIYKYVLAKALMSGDGARTLVEEVPELVREIEAMKF